MGGKWGEESPNIATDLIITGLVCTHLKLNKCNCNLLKFTLHEVTMAFQLLLLLLLIQHSVIYNYDVILKQAKVRHFCHAFIHSLVYTIPLTANHNL